MNALSRLQARWHPRRPGSDVIVAASVNGAFGKAGLMLTLAAATLGALTTAYAIARHDTRSLRLAPRYTWLCVAGAVLSVLMMQRALITRDFSLAYVQQVGSASTPLLYNIAAMWSALEGSILLWVLILSGYTAAVGWRFRSRTSDPLVGWALVVMFVVMAFFALLSFGPAEPVRSTARPGSPTGRDPTRCCRTTSSCRSTRRSSTSATSASPCRSRSPSPRWSPAASARAGCSRPRRWALFAWGFLTIGIILGGWWSYEVLGWGGFWAWDPVENASLLPWLTATAFIHSVIVQERRGMLRVWNLSLLVATFSLTILGTFLTRSGLLSSVHAFSDGPVGA